MITTTLMMALCTTLTFAKGVEGTWNASIETDNGPFEFTVVYEVDDEKITGEFITEWGNLEFGPGTIKGKEFEYTFEIEYVTYTHKGKLIKKNEILIKSSNANGEEIEFTLTREP
jgi:hypothetical protein